MSLTNILDTAEVRATLAAMSPDPQLATLRATHDAQRARLATARERAGQIDARIVAIDRELVDAEDRERPALLGERGLLREERHSLPGRLTEEARRTVAAELAVCGHLNATIRPYGLALAAELAPLEASVGQLRRRMTGIEAGLQSREEKATQGDELAAELAALAPQLRCLRTGVAQAQQALALIAGHVESQHGERVVATNPLTYHAAGEALGRRLVRALGAA